MVEVRGEGRGDVWHGEWLDVMTWPCHGGQVRWERVQRGCTDVQGCARVSGQSEVVRVGLGPLIFPAWAILHTLPARCLQKWPQETLF